jgi:hypothetical protein
VADQDDTPASRQIAQWALDIVNLYMSINQDWQVTPQPNGQLQWGFPQTTPPLSIATIPNQTTNQNVAYSVNLSTYVTGTYVSLSIIGTLPTGWAFDGTNLAYSGTLADSAAIQLQANPATGTPAVSNTFTIQALAVISPDTTAPNTPFQPAVALNSSYQPVITWLASADGQPPNQNWSGMKGYPIKRNGALITTVPSDELNTQFSMAAADIGAPTTAGSTVQTGIALAITSYGQDFYGAADQGQFSGAQVTGNFTAGCIVQSITSSGTLQEFAKVGISARNAIGGTGTNGPGSPNVSLVACPPALGGGYLMTGRTSQGGATTTFNANVIAYTAPLWLLFTRVGNVFTGSYSHDGVNFTQLSQQTVSLSATIYLGFFATSHDATGASSVTANLTNCFVSQDASYSYTDTAIGQTGSAQNLTYETEGEDQALNISTGAPVISITIPASGGGGGGGAGVTVSNGQWLYNGVAFSPVGFSMNSMQETQGKGSRWAGMQQSVASYQAMAANALNVVGASANARKCATLNTMRIMMCPGAWMGYTGILPTSAAASNFNSAGGGLYYTGAGASAAAAAAAYQAQIKSMITNAVQAGFQMIVIDPSWPTPILDSTGQYILSIGQSAMPSMADAAFWGAFSKALGRGSGFQYANNLVYELYNEPFYDNSYGDATNLATGVKDLASGSGTFTNYQEQDNFNCLGHGVNAQFAVAGGAAVRWVGYNSLISAIRANGDTNVCLVGCPWFSGEIEFFLNMPIVDSANQFACSYHPYSTNAGQRPNGVTILNAIQKAGYAVCATELGFLSNVQSTYIGEYNAGRGYIWCSYNNWNSNAASVVAAHMASVSPWNSQQIAPQPTGSN